MAKNLFLLNIQALFWIFHEKVPFSKSPIFSPYLKDINFRAVVIFAPRKNAKITTRENNNTWK